MNSKYKMESKDKLMCTATSIFRNAQKTGGVLQKPVHKMSEEIKSSLVIFYASIFMVRRYGFIIQLGENQIKSGIGSCNALKAGLACHPLSIIHFVN
jgi:hypothetical protein